MSAPLISPMPAYIPADSLAGHRESLARRNGMVKVNPLARWTQADVDAYADRHGILTNPLLEDGFTSVGCFPCTRPTTADGRSGRWSGQDKSECGIHVMAPA